MRKLIQLLSFSLVLLSIISCKKDNLNPDDKLIKDGSGNIYTEIQIGEQIWLKEDLATKKYIGGTLIGSDSYQDKGNSGFYYSDFADFDRICPEGYKIPTKYDFERLIAYFGGESLNESQIIEAYVNKWNGNPNGGGDGIMNQGSGLYWPSSDGSKYGHYYFYFRTINAGISVKSYTFDSFFHVKCIKK